MFGILSGENVKNVAKKITLEAVYEVVDQKTRKQNAEILELEKINKPQEDVRDLNSKLDSVMNKLIQIYQNISEKK
ncbi:MAG: hypothetical protein ABWJ98_08065 [Hydrogenothermaceae bacterium]